MKKRPDLLLKVYCTWD